MNELIAALDVSYPLGGGAMAAGVVFREWSDTQPMSEHQLQVAAVSPYIPGAFYRRELPCLLALLEAIDQPLTAIVIDGYVWLSEKQRPGLGARLHEALGGTIPIIGVAKSLFRGSLFAAPVQRGNSKLPLYITAAGIDTAHAALLVQSMHGKHRVPTLLKRVDQLSKSGMPAP
jgi:deoxyribonuclease V